MTAVSATIRVRYVARSVVEKSDGSPRLFIGMEDVASRVGRLSVGQLSEKSATDALLARAGDVLFGKLRPYLAKSYLVPEDVSCTGEFLVLRPRPGFSSRFLFYLTLSQPWLEWAEATSYGSKMPRTSWELMAETETAAPEIRDQEAVADFLEAETAKIDALIAKQEHLIATLREDRTATITHAVTKGLDPDVATKDSGIHGLGSIPVSWSVTPLLRCVEGRVDYRGATPKKVDDGVLLITARNVRPGWIDYEISDEYVSAEDYGEIMRRGLPEINDLLFTMEAPLGNAALVDRTDIALAQRIIKFRPDAQVVLPRYLLYSVIGEWFQSQLVARATGSTALGLKASKLPELRVAVPDMNEQSRIVEFLDERWAKIDELVAKAAEVVETLREYRSALITDAVTGKIDVRRVA